MKESREVLEIINNRLMSRFGRYSDGRAYWRVVWSEDEFETRSGTFTDYTREGIFLREVTEVRHLPKYRQWMQPPRYVLEGLKEINEGAQTDLLTKTSYEPAWSFIDGMNRALPLKWEAIEFIVLQIYKSMAGESHHEEWKDPLSAVNDPEAVKAYKEKEIDKLQEQLFGEESEIADALHYREGIIVPQTYNKTEIH